MSFFKKIRRTISNNRRAQGEVANPVYTNDGIEIEETQMKMPFPSESPQPGQSTYVPQLRTTFQTEETNKPKAKKAISCLKFSILTVVIFSAITAIIILINHLRETNKAENTDTKRTFVCNSPVQTTLQNNISFDCNFTVYKLKDVSIRISSPGNNNSVNLTLEKPTQIPWSMNQTSDSTLQIKGPQMLCNSPGMYQLDIITGGTINTTANISIKTPTPATSNITEVNLTFDRVTSCTTNDEVSQFYVSCAARSGCEQSSLSFLAISANETYNLELPFTCSTNYTNANGWYVNCSGTINDTLSKRIKEIKCHPSSGQLKEARRLLPQCNLTGKCIARGVTLGDNIIIVCNTTSNATSVDEILSPTNKTLDMLQWNVSQKNYTITLQGPKANCSSAGEYMINTSNSNKNSSQVQRVTVEIIEKTDFNKNSSCSTCESYPKCQRSYILRMDSSDTSPDNSFSSNCTTTYSDSSGSITRCVGPSQWNGTVSCTLSDSKTVQATNVTKC